MCQEQEGLARVEPLDQNHVPGHGVSQGPHPHLHTLETLRSVIPHTPIPEERGCNQLPVEEGGGSWHSGTKCQGDTSLCKALCWSWPQASVWLCQRQGDTGKRDSQKGRGWGRRAGRRTEEGGEKKAKSPIRERAGVSEEGGGHLQPRPWVQVKRWGREDKGLPCPPPPPLLPPPALGPGPGLFLAGAEFSCSLGNSSPAPGNAPAGLGEKPESSGPGGGEKRMGCSKELEGYLGI